MKREKQIQISQKLFIELIQYFIGGKEDNFDTITEELNSKLDRVVEHDLYTTYKTALTDEEKERARQEYLDKKGIPQNLRWSEGWTGVCDE